MPCMNWKLILSGGAVGVAIAAIFPGAAAAVLPLLVIAVCPLAMVFGMAILARTDSDPANSSREVEELRAEISLLRGGPTTNAGSVQ